MVHGGVAGDKGVVEEEVEEWLEGEEEWRVKDTQEKWMEYK